MVTNDVSKKLFNIQSLPSWEGYFCYFDILGYSSFILQSDTKVLTNDLLTLRDIIIQSSIQAHQDVGILKNEQEMVKFMMNPYDHTIGLHFYYTIISDSIFIWGMDSIERLITSLKAIFFILEQLVIRQKRFARGAITKGRLFINPLANMYYGKPFSNLRPMRKK
ncbi:hypothetical protein KKG05_06905 [bacterium]|nr:hypothetical protein [bacterium]